MLSKLIVSDFRRNMMRYNPSMTAPETTFRTAFGKLNPAQKEAVEALEGPVMVVAGFLFAL
jgi:hypothetical protein